MTTENYDKFIPQHPKRLKIYNNFLELLIKFNENNEIKLDNYKLQKMALNIERGIFNYSLNHAKKTSMHWNYSFQKYYIQRCVVIYSNLNPESPVKNHNLIKRFLNNEFNEYDLAFFTSEELFPEQYDYLTKLHGLDKIILPCDYKPDVPDGIIKCYKCKSFKTTYYEMQTRSADENTTKYVKCHNCGNKFKMG